jgi:hypothetical protein
VLRSNPLIRQFSKYIVVGKPQIIALLMLALFAGEALWVARHARFTPDEQDHIWAGRQQLERDVVPRAMRHSPLVNLAAATGLHLERARIIQQDPTPEHVRAEIQRLHLLTRVPFILFGIGLGVSLWYVARRLYGNEGGYIALLLYAMSPAVVMASARAEETIPAAWGLFGVIFVSIALAHNLYAPWRKWRYRTVLLAVAMFIGVASHPAVIPAIIASLIFPLYLAPGRRWVGVALTFVAAAIGVLLVLASYGFVVRAMEYGVYLPQWFTFAPREAVAGLFESSAVFMSRFSSATEVMFVISLATFAFWKRTRYFGNAAPLLIFAVILTVALLTPLVLLASVWCLPFLFIFIGGIFADLLETKYRRWVIVALMVLFAEQAWFCGWMLVHAVRA